MKLQTARALIAIEVDPTRSLPRLAPLDRENAEKLGDAVAEDWQKMLPQAAECALVMAGAVYDQTQVLSPGFPLYRTLTELYEGQLQGEFEPAFMALGAADGAMPRPQLQPALERLTGPMLIVPLAVVGPESKVIELARAMEETLVANGQVSANTALALNATFGFDLVHAQYLTTNDLAAMLSLQLSNVGLPELWDLLEGALYAPDEPLWIETEAGGQLALIEGHAEALFQSFDQWAAGPGKTHDDEELAHRYASYLRTQRQVTVTLNAHGVPVRVFPLEQPVENLAAWTELRSSLKPADESDPVWVEVAVDGPRDGPLQITQHSVPELGSVAITLQWSDAAGNVHRRENHYPLLPAGVKSLMSRVQALEVDERCYSYPGCIVFDQEQRVLVPDPDGAPPNWH